MGAETYRIQQIYPMTIGALRGIDVTDPMYWGQTDSYAVWLSKEN
jgi:hypothetical protein